MNTLTVIKYNKKKSSLTSSNISAFIDRKRQWRNTREEYGLLNKLKLKRAQFESTPLFLSTPIN